MVSYGNSVVTNGQPSAMDLGMHVLGSAPLPLFTLENRGQESLSVSQLDVSGSFTKAGPGTTNLGPSALTTFTIRPLTTALGVHTGMVTITSSDGLAAPFSFPVRATIIQENPRFTGIEILGTFVELNFRAPTNSACRLESSTNLTSWIPVTTIIVDSSGAAEYFTPASTSSKGKFYRLVLQ